MAKKRSADAEARRLARCVKKLTKPLLKKKGA